MFFSTLKNITYLLFIVLLTACPFEKSSDDAQQLELYPASLANHNLVKINKSFLKEPILLNTSIINNLEQTSFSLNGKIVYFTQSGHNIYLNEAQNGIVPLNNIFSNLILAAFPIITQDNDSLTFDFNAGMNMAYVSNWYFDSAGKDFSYNYADLFQAMSYGNQFTRSMYKDKTLLHIVQSGQSALNSNIVSFDINYDFRLNVKSENFQEYLYSIWEPVRFFQTKPMMSEEEITIDEKTGEKINYSYNEVKAIKWDISEPIFFVASSNTPKEYLEAIKQGVLYWNRAAKKKIVDFAIASDFVEDDELFAPQPFLNIIQWLDNTSIDHAYADVVAHPKTGQAITAQVYLPSSFAFSNLNALKRLAKKTEHKYSKKHQHSLSKICKLTLDFSDSLRNIASLDEDISKENILKISKYIVSSTVAHEIGHILGLRHNFAGNLSATITRDERDKKFKELLVKGNISGEKDKISSSVMDYLTFKDNVLIGWQIYNDDFKSALSYDEYAINLIYQKELKSKVKNSNDLFCTDHQISKYIDCKPFDFGENTLKFNSQSIEKTVKFLSSSLIEHFIFLMTSPNPSEKIKDIKKILLPKISVERIARNYYQLSKWYAKEPYSLYAANNLSKTKKLDVNFLMTNKLIYARDLDEAKFSLIEEDPLFAYLPGVIDSKENFISKNIQELSSYLKNVNSDIVGYNYKKFHFSDDDIAYIKKIAQNYFSFFYDKVIEVQLDILNQANFDYVDAKLESNFEKMAKTIILPKSGSSHEFSFEEKIRLLAAKSLSKKRSSQASFCQLTRTNIIKQLIAAINDYLVTNFTFDNVDALLKADTSKMLPVKGRWLAQQQNILTILLDKE